MKHHIIALALLVCGAACTEESYDQEDHHHMITWRDSLHSATASLSLYDNGTATIEVSEPDFYFLHQKETVNYFWSETDSTFTLKHAGSGINIVYEIVSKTEDYLELNYHDALSVEIRKASSSHSVN